jgi:hypothetical protein
VESLFAFFELRRFACQARMVISMAVSGTPKLSASPRFASAMVRAPPAGRNEVKLFSYFALSRRKGFE